MHLPTVQIMMIYKSSDVDSGLIRAAAIPEILSFMH